MRRNKLVLNIGKAIFYIASFVSYFLLWNLFLRFPEEITAKLVFLILCPFIICLLTYTLYTKEKGVLERNSWRRMGRKGEVI